MHCVTDREITSVQVDAWQAFLRATGRDADTPLYDVFFFGDSEVVVEALNALVLRGTKTATASLLAEYEATRPPAPGDLSIATSWHGSPVCVIESTQIQVTPYAEVDAAFAAAEGEGDGSLAFWRRVHWDYFGHVCEQLGQTPDESMLVVCEHFRRVHRF